MTKITLRFVQNLRTHIEDGDDIWDDDDLFPSFEKIPRRKKKDEDDGEDEE